MHGQASAWGVCMCIHVRTCRYIHIWPLELSSLDWPKEPLPDVDRCGQWIKKFSSENKVCIPKKYSPAPLWPNGKGAGRQPATPVVRLTPMDVVTDVYEHIRASTLWRTILFLLLETGCFIINAIIF